VRRLKKTAAQIMQATFSVARLWFVLLACACAAPATAQALPDNTRVRIVASGLGNGEWLEGKASRNKGSGCTMVLLDRKQPGGYTMVALNSVKKLERQEKGAWVDVPVKPLLDKETKSCREAAND
jgi:hypothetical protein